MKPLVKTGLAIVIGLLGLGLVAHYFGTGLKPLAGKDHASAPFKIGKTETHSSLSSTTTSSSSDNSTFSSRRVLLVTDNPHPLIQRVAVLLAERLKNCPQIDQLEVTNLPVALTNAADAPDLFLHLDLAGLQEQGTLSSSIKVNVDTTLGNSPWQSSSYYQDGSTPPQVNFAWNATLESQSTFRGIRTDRYADAASSIADELAKAIRNQIEELSMKYSVPPELPPDFYGPYQPVTDFDFLQEVKARRAVSYYGLFTHNQTFWQFQTATNPVPQLQHIISRLEADGWKLSDTRLTNTESCFIRCHQGKTGADLEIFPRRTARSFSFDSRNEAGTEFIVHYRKPFTQAEREVALEKLFIEPQPVETLIPFRNFFSSAQREKFYALVEKSPAAPPQACIQLAEVYLSRRQTNSAVNMFLRAKALAATVQDASSLESSIGALAKKISPQQSLQLKVTPEICHELGFLEITNAPQTFEQTRVLGQPLLMFGAGASGLKLCSLTIRPPQKGVYPWALVWTEEGVRSTSSSSFNLTSQGDWRQSFTFEKQTVNIIAVPLPDQKQVKFTIHLEK